VSPADGSGSLARAILDALPHHVLVLDAEGRVIATNEAWDRFTENTVGALSNARLGCSYLDACRDAVHAGEQDAIRLLQGLQALLDMEQEPPAACEDAECAIEYAWPAATTRHTGAQRWYLIHARRPRGGPGIVLCHIEISRCKATEQQLRDALGLIQSVIDGTDTLVYAKDLEGRYMLTNRSWRDRAGLSRRQALQATDERVYGARLALALRTNDERALRTGRLIVAEETARSRGQPATFLSSKFPLVDDRGQAFAVGGVSTDITNLKQLQAALQARERELQSLADHTPDVLVRLDAQGRVVFVNAAVHRMVGRRPAELMGSTPRDGGLPERLCEAWNTAAARVRDDGLPQATEFSLEAPRGLRHYSGRFVPEFGEGGAIETVLGVLVDVTDQKAAEEAVQTLLVEERHYARLLSLLAEASRLVHASLSAHEIAQVLTDQARAILGAQRASTTVLPHDGADRPIRTHSRCCDESGSDDPPAQGALRVQLTGQAGRPLGVLEVWGRQHDSFCPEDESILIQLGAIAATGLDNARLYTSLREADVRKDEFLATLAHELRNPLAPIRNGLEILRRGKPLGDQHAQANALALSMMERQITHLVRLVDDLLDVARISRGKVDLRCERITVQAVVDSALEASRPAIDAGRHVLAVDMPSAPLRIDGDLTRLAQVLGNLLNNAAKYTPEGGQIQLSVRPEGPMVAVAVSDNGVGLSTETLPRVFDLFAQIEHTLSRSQGGLGIGLSLVKQLVEMHGGSIMAESAGLGQGSRFTVRLPLSRTAPGPILHDAPRASPARPPSLRVLVVDDNVDAAESLAMMLALLGHEARTAHDGAAAIAVAGQWRPEVVLLDIGLPDLTGYDVARRLRADERVAGAMMVAVTGWGTEDDRRRSAEAGFDQHLTKPVDASVLERLLGNRQLAS
jgi:PAS domain S-box-containing protein